MNVVYRRSQLKKQSDLKKVDTKLPMLGEATISLNVGNAFSSKSDKKWSEALSTLMIKQTAKTVRSTTNPLPEEEYLLALTLIDKRHYEEARLVLTSIKSKLSDEGQLLTMLALCESKCGNLNEALTLVEYPCKEKRVESLLLRAKLHNSLHSYLLALNDLEQIIKISSDHSEAIELKSLILAKTLQWTKLALFLETQALQKFLSTATIAKLELLHIQALIGTQKYEFALEKIKGRAEESSDYLFLKGRALMGQGRKVQALAEWNQSLLVRSDWSSAEQAAISLCMHYLQQTDFYEALTILRRVERQGSHSQSVNQLLLLVEGVTSLMKRKYLEALSFLAAVKPIILPEICRSNFLSNIFYHAMGYGYFSMGEHSKSLDFYRQVKEDKSISSVHLYNIALCQGILAHRSGMVQQSLTFFDKAIQYSNRPEPYFYIAVVSSRHWNDSEDPRGVLEKVLDIIQKGLLYGENCHMLYFRALLQINLGIVQEALQAIDKAIERSEENIPAYFYLRGALFMQEKDYQQAINQFLTCLSIDETNEDAIALKAKCQFFNGNTAAAFLDIEGISLQEEWTAIFNLYLRNFSEIANAKQLGECQIVHAAKFFLGNFQQAGPAGRLILAVIYKSYHEVNELLSEAISAHLTVGCLQMEDLMLLRAYCCFKLQRFDESLKLLMQVQTGLKNKAEKQTEYCEEDQKRILICNINSILIYMVQGQTDHARMCLDALLNEVYEGTVHDEIYHFKDALGSQVPTTVALMTSEQLISDLFVEEVSPSGLIKFRFMYPFPRIRAAQMEECIHQRLLQSFDLAQIDDRPEAIWIRRTKHGVMFTSDVREFVGLNLRTEDNEKQSLADSLRLSSTVRRKLEKIEQKGNEKAILKESKDEREEKNRSPTEGQKYEDD